MLELDDIDQASARRGRHRADLEPMRQRPIIELDAPYVAEMARLELRPALRRRPPRAPATRSTPPSTGACRPLPTARVRVGLIEYDRRHGWRGPAGHVDAAPRTASRDLRRAWSMSTRAIGNLSPAVVAVGDATRRARAYVQRAAARSQIDWDGTVLGAQGAAQREPGAGAEGCRAGAARAATWSTWSPTTRAHAQLGAATRVSQGALVALDPEGAAIFTALVGGYDG